MSFYPFILRKISVLTELILGHLCYSLTDVPPQPNSPPNNVSHMDHTLQYLAHFKSLHEYHLMELVKQH